MAAPVSLVEILSLFDNKPHPDTLFPEKKLCIANLIDLFIDTE